MTDDDLHKARDVSLMLADQMDKLAEMHDRLGQSDDAALLRVVADSNRKVAERYRVQIEQRAWMATKARIAQ